MNILKIPALRTLGLTGFALTALLSFSSAQATIIAPPEPVDATMTTPDKVSFQEAFQLTTGEQTSWYNTDTITHYSFKMGRKYSYDLRPCACYTLEVKHMNQTTLMEREACLNYDGEWVQSIHP